MRRFLYVGVLVCTLGFCWVLGQQTQDASDGKPVLDPATGLVVDEALPLVKANCTACHSAQLVTQNRMNGERWRETIRWMQKEQGLWQIPGPMEDQIVAYLAKHYSPENRGRRLPLPYFPPKPNKTEVQHQD